MIREAFRALWEYRLRALLTLSILAFGITALVGILTSMEALRNFIARNLAGLGTQAFSISGGERTIQISVGRRRFASGKGKGLRSWEAAAFAERFSYPGARLSRHIPAYLFVQAHYQSRKTPAQVRVFGVEPSYFSIQEIKLREGHPFTPLEISQALPVILLGAEVAAELFPNESPLNKWVQVGSSYYRVVGVVAPRGSLFGFSLDTECFIPWTVARKERPNAEMSLMVGVPSAEEVPQAMQVARAHLRAIRRLQPAEEDDFSLFRGEMLADFMLDQLKYVTLATIGISLLTLFGATLSLTNIMLVVVKERTQEIGLRMALGATRGHIQRQFLTEAVVVSLAGGMGGIALGLFMGNFVAWFIGGSFVMPWKWVAMAVLLSTAVGIAAGFQPAREAAQLNPVEALRYE